MNKKLLREELREVISELCSVIRKVSAKEHATAAELVALAEIANSITAMTGYASIEAKRG